MKVHSLYNSDTERKEKVLEILNKVGLDEGHYNRYPHEFSGGQRQRIGIARTIALQPKLIICDESVSAFRRICTGTGIKPVEPVKKRIQFFIYFYFTRFSRSEVYGRPVSGDEQRAD